MIEQKLIELTLSMEVVDADQAVLPSEAAGPTIIRITPVEEVRLDKGLQKSHISFRVAFEPDNPERRKQPYRECIAPVFPGGWKLGDHYDSGDEPRFV